MTDASMRRPPRSLLNAIAMLLACAASAWALADAELDAGRRLYREGRLADGTPVHATGAGAVTPAGEAAACEACHRRSGFGTGEGRRVIAPLPHLFAPRSSVDPALRARPISGGKEPVRYDDAKLARALREGIAADGRVLDALMPRYELPDSAVPPLTGYIARLAQHDTPGVDEDTIRFATIVTPDVSPARAEAVLAVLRAFVAERSGGARSESRRRKAGSDWMYQGYRRWALDEWRLVGEPREWGSQLEALYAKAPVFALLSGVGGDWSPIHAFCARREVPCLLPLAGFAPAEPDFYSIYFASPGILDGAIAASVLSGAAPVLQVRGASAHARLAADALRQARPGTQLREIGVDEAPAAPGDAEGAALVLWLDAAELASFAQRADVRESSRILVSARLVSASELPDALASHPGLRMIYPYDLPRDRVNRLGRVRAWMGARGIEVTDELDQANAFFAASLASETIGHMGGEFSRELFIERIEHMAGRALNTSAFPRLGLAPSQHFASKGGYLVRLTGAERSLVAEGGWVVP